MSAQLGGTDRPTSGEYRFSRRALVFSTVFDAMERADITILYYIILYCGRGGRGGGLRAGRRGGGAEEGGSVLAASDSG